MIREQEVSNLLVNKKYHEALKIALNLNQPYRTLTIIKGNKKVLLSDCDLRAVVSYRNSQ